MTLFVMFVLHCSTAILYVMFTLRYTVLQDCSAVILYVMFIFTEVNLARRPTYANFALGSDAVRGQLKVL